MPRGRRGFQGAFATLWKMRVFVLLAVLCGVMPAQETAVAVLPFFNLTGSGNLDWIGESVSETICRALEAEGITVADRESRAEAYRQLALHPSAQLALGSVIKLGRTLEVRWVIYGSFQISPLPKDGPLAADGTLELTARVLDLGELRQSEPWTATGQMQDLAEVQNRLAWLALGRLVPADSVPTEEQFRLKHKPVRLDALESYIRGLMTSSAEQKHRFLTQAVRLDESFTAPYFELGRLLYQGEKYAAAAGWLERVSPEDPNSVEAAFLLGLCRYRLAEFEKAESAFRSLVSLLPRAEVWNNLGAAQSRLARPEAVESFRRAVELDPNEPGYRFNLGYALWKMERYEEAAEVFRGLLGLTPEDPQATLMVGRCLNRTPPSGVAVKMEGFERVQFSVERTVFRRFRLGTAHAAH
ncbi:MAG: tetratricopeptide repeat protein [Bryobacteraceae bacterium]